MFKIEIIASMFFFLSDAYYSYQYNIF